MHPSDPSRILPAEIPGTRLARAETISLPGAFHALQRLNARKGLFDGPLFVLEEQDLVRSLDSHPSGKSLIDGQDGSVLAVFGFRDCLVGWRDGTRVTLLPAGLSPLGNAYITDLTAEELKDSILPWVEALAAGFASRGAVSPPLMFAPAFTMGAVADFVENTRPLLAWAGMNFPALSLIDFSAEWISVPQDGRPPYLNGGCRVLGEMGGRETAHALMDLIARKADKVAEKTGLLDMTPCLPGADLDLPISAGKIVNIVCHDPGSISAHDRIRLSETHGPAPRPGMSTAEIAAL